MHDYASVFTLVKQLHRSKVVSYYAFVSDFLYLAKQTRRIFRSKAHAYVTSLKRR